MILVKHSKVSAIADDPSAVSAGEVVPSDWNADHVVDGLGTAAEHDVEFFATAAQGSKADTAVQPLDLSPVATSGAYSDLTGKPTLGTAASTDSSEYATAAQGAKADTALQSVNWASPSAIGSATPAAGTFTTLIGGKDQVNYGQLTGGATTKAVEFKSLGSDTNVALALRTQGTGAIDLAAGSRGVNISNGGTVTALTVTASGANYTSIPSCAITAPTTAGGVQATATPVMFSGAASTVASGGTGYTVGDTLTVVGGTYTTQATFTVSSVSAGVVTGITRVGGAGYSVLPSSPATTTGGTGTGCTINMLWTVGTSTITNAGSGYVEQPTVTFSGGGGSGAAAYATVGSDTTVKSLGTSIFFSHPNGVGLQVKDTGQVGCYPLLQSSGTTIQAYASSVTASNVGYQWATKGVSGHAFATNNSVSNNQFTVSHTASAVNYVQVTGAATGSGPTISAQGSNSDIDFNIAPKGTNGRVRFGTYTGTALSIAGYIEIKDAGGTVRKLAVVA